MSPLGAIRPDPGPARSWVERELSRPEYHESLLQQLFGWIEDVWRGLRTAALGASTLSVGAAVVVAVVLVVLVALVAGRVRREPLRAATDRAVLGDGTVTSQQHRSAAESAVADGELDRAIVEAFRAIAVRAVERAVLDERPGLTAHELVLDLAPVFPEHAEGLGRASVLFDLVFYGDQPATPDDAHSVLDLDEALRLARPAQASRDRRGSWAVPR